jgi:predicted DCC family thiol-disulfide oxidoreductase YuxK
MKRKVLIYDPRCPKCKFIGKLVKFFDFGGKFTFFNLTSKEAVDLLHEFYPRIPYNFHFIIDHKDLCYTGIKAIPAILFELISGLFWPFGGKGPHWMKEFKQKILH